MLPDNLWTHRPKQSYAKTLAWRRERTTPTAIASRMTRAFAQDIILAKSCLTAASICNRTLAAAMAQ